MTKKELEKNKQNLKACKLALNLADITYEELPEFNRYVVIEIENLSKYFDDAFENALVSTNHKGDVILDILNTNYCDYYYLKDEKLKIEFVTSYEE